MRNLYSASFLLLAVLCGIASADSWVLYDNFELGAIDTSKWSVSGEYGGNIPSVAGGKCVLSGIDIDNTPAASSSISSIAVTKAVKCDINLVPVVFNNDPGQGQTGDFELNFYANLSNGMYCLITLFDSGLGLNGNALVQDAMGGEVSAAAFTAAYSTSAAYSIEIHDDIVMFKKNDALLLSWTAGEEVAFSGFSFTAQAVFCQFSATLDNVLTADTPDYGNNYQTAYPINADSTTYYGILDSGDSDWFYFEKPANGRYRFTFINANYNWKYIYIYQMNQFGNLVEQKNMGHYVTYPSPVTTLFFEPQYDCYIKVQSDAGNYAFRVDYIDNTAADYYSNSCADATPLILNAAATIGTLDHTNPDTFDTDWFVFDTEPLHMYEITLTRAENSDAYFVVYPDDCGTAISGGYTSYTIVSWFGESYKLRVTGTSTGIGHYYTIRVTDLGLQSDDYGNTSSLAQPIVPDGQNITGSIQYVASYQSDQDWFVFSKSQYGRYRFTFKNANNNWKYMYIYQMNEFGQLVEQKNIGHYTTYNYAQTTLFFEPGYDCYIKIQNEAGDYSFNVEYLDTTPPDNYGKSCEEVAQLTQLVAGNSPTIGTLNHVGSTLTQDWFYFNTLAMHKYQITLTHAENSDSYFALYPDSCGAAISGANTSYTLVSWFGEKYKLLVSGSSLGIGHYYTIQVTDLGLQPDDWPNIYSLAPTVAKDGSWIDGNLEYAASYHSDEDWMKFMAGIDGSYTIRFNNVDYNWKYIYIYKVNEVGTPVQIMNMGAYKSYGISSTTQNLTAGLHYIKVQTDTGNYQVSILSPEPRCGDLEHPYPAGDTNRDCYVNLSDIAVMSADWLQCTDPNPPCEFLPL